MPISPTVDDIGRTVMYLGAGAVSIGTLDALHPSSSTCVIVTFHYAPAELLGTQVANRLCLNWCAITLDDQDG